MKILLKIKDGKPVESSTYLTFLQANEGKTAELRTVRDTRTDAQNRALHLWFTLVAEALNEAGYTVQQVLQQKLDLDFNAGIIKEVFWRDAQKKVVGKISTTKLDKIEDINKIYDHLNRHFGEKFKIHVPFPQKCQHCHMIDCVC